MNTDFTPYYAVIFTSKHTINIEGYKEMSEKMEQLAKQLPGYISMDSAKDSIGITVSYWESLDAIKNWKEQTEHLRAQQKGRMDWYSWYQVRICKVEREYGFDKII